MRVGIVAQRENERAAYLAADVGELLDEAGAEAGFDAATAETIGRGATPVEEFDETDLVVSIGGDGTFLFAARHAGTTPVLGVNLGEVGFLNAVPPSGAVEAVREELAAFEEEGSVRSRPIPRLEASGEGEWSLPPALNEVVVQGPQRGPGQGANFEVRVDGSLYTATAADGVLVATPTGSTAYNLSEGGPLVRPEADIAVVTGMCPAEPMPPLAVDLGSEVTVRVDGAEAGHVLTDGANDHELDLPATVTIERAAEPAQVAGPPVEFFQALNKLE
jgi:NAD+ kinase